MPPKTRITRQGNYPLFRVPELWSRKDYENTKAEKVVSLLFRQEQKEKKT